LAACIADSTGAVPREVVRDDDGTSIKGLTKFGDFADD
jgi:hypothetical protein